MAKPGIMKAQYKTMCKFCYQTVAIGETIRVYDDKWYHNKCSHRIETLTKRRENGKGIECSDTTD